MDEDDMREETQEQTKDSRKKKERKDLAGMMKVALGNLWENKKLEVQRISELEKRLFKQRYS